MTLSPRRLGLCTTLLIAACGIQVDSPDDGLADELSPTDEACVRVLLGDGKSAAEAKRTCALNTCGERRDFVLHSIEEAYTPNAIRWSCSDVRGVNTLKGDDRGQEYCEYFAVVKVPKTGNAVSDKSPGVSHSIVLGQSADQRSLTLDAKQRETLAQLGTDEVGRCVFTSWHSDVAGPVPACAPGKACPKVLDEPVSTNVFRMVGSINSNGAARDLVNKCLTKRGDKTVTDDYDRGCMMAASLFGTHWRKSDPTICAGVMRMSECGCNVAPAVSKDVLAGKVITAQPSAEGAGTRVTLRGFPLGGWPGLDKLPAGCDYIDVGAEANGQPSRTLVSCIITADDLMKSATDMKEFCRTTYGAGVVVHVPIPGDALSCTPPAGAMCTAQPWIVEGA